MIADCVDEIEWKTGQRKDGLAYAGYGLFSKIASAFTKALGHGCCTPGPAMPYLVTPMWLMPPRRILL